MACSSLPWGRPSFFVVCRLRSSLRLHQTMRVRQRDLSTEMMMDVVSTFELIESYPDDKYLPSFLVRGESAGTLLRADRDRRGGKPRPEEWTQGLRIRRAKT
jgi:hypothetical protein